MVKSNVRPLLIKNIGVSRRLLVLTESQYIDDPGVYNALINYVGAINTEGWTTTIDGNCDELTLAQIDAEIELQLATAVLVIGENGPLHTSPEGMEYAYSPSLVPYYKTGNYDSDCRSTGCEIPEQRIKMETPISLLLPNYDDSFSTRTVEITNTLNRFASNRSAMADLFGSAVRMSFYSERDNHDVAAGQWLNIASQISGASNIYINYDVDRVDTLIAQSMAAIMTGYADVGSGSNRGLKVSYTSIGLPVVVKPEIFETPLLMMNTDSAAFGWKNSDPEVFGVLKPPSNFEGWLCHAILTSDHLRVILRAPFTDPADFINAGTLATGGSIAEAITNKYMTSPIMYGDPTFHY